MFRNKKIEEYKRISNSVKLPDIKESIGQEKNKVIKLNEKENRNERGSRKMKKLIASGLIAAALGGIVIFNNIGGGVTGVPNVEKVNNDIIVYASVNEGEKVKLEKGKELPITEKLIAILASDDKNKETKTVKSGIKLDIISEDMKEVSLKTDKGGLGDGIIEIVEDKNGKAIFSEKEQKEIKVEFKKEKGGLEEEIVWYYDEEMLSLKNKIKLNKETFGTVNIQMEATYENGQKQTGTIQLTMNEKGEIVGRIA